MAHFAQLDENNVVTNVVVVNNEDIQNLDFPDSEPIGVEFLRSLFGQDTQWKQTSFNSKFRKQFAAIGYTYSTEYDAFVEFKPHVGWVFDSSLLTWGPPTPCPGKEGVEYTWSDEQQGWVAI